MPFTRLKAPMNSMKGSFGNSSRCESPLPASPSSAIASGTTRAVAVAASRSSRKSRSTIVCTYELMLWMALSLRRKSGALAKTPIAAIQPLGRP